MEEKIKKYFCDKSKQSGLKKIATLMFMVLVIEKIISGMSAIYIDGELTFQFILTITDIMSVCIYMSMVFLLVLKVRYMYLLIPDFFLLGIKVYVLATGVKTLYLNKRMGELLELTTIETVVECFLFAMFLVLLFIGKLSSENRKIYHVYPMVCMYLLGMCFVETVVFEMIKCVVATEMHQYPFVVMFNFVKGVLNETFLDLPYVLLVLLVCFTKQENKKAKNISLVKRKVTE